MGEFPGLPKAIMPCVDVRDCALAHLNAIKKSEADNKRIFLSENEYWITQIGETLNEEFGGGKGYNPTYNQINYWLLWTVSWCDGEAASMIGMWGIEKHLDNSPSKDLLGIKYRPLKETLKDMVEALIKTGYIPD
jgi:dihydroflavonol-4-reductase